MSKQVAQPRLVNSANQPISISWIPLDAVKADQPLGGRLGLTYCPGKHIVARDGTRYTRDLQADLSRLKNEHGVQVVVCFLPEAELRYLQVRDYAAAVVAHGMEYLNLPIIEMAPPTDVQQAAILVEAIVQHLQHGHTVVMHCKGGVGRAGLIAACVLTWMGQCSSPSEAIAIVRRHRKGAVESRKQEDFVTAFWRFSRQDRSS